MLFRSERKRGREEGREVTREGEERKSSRVLQTLRFVATVTRGMANDAGWKYNL